MNYWRAIVNVNGLFGSTVNVMNLLNFYVKHVPVPVYNLVSAFQIITNHCNELNKFDSWELTQK